MNDILKRIGEMGIVPVIKIEDVEKAVPLAQALIDGGLPCAEITFRTAAGVEAIRRVTEAFPDMLVGAGTVLSTEQVDQAVAAGATFIVSPGLNPKVVKYCVDKGILILPGCANPSDVEQAIEYGLEVVKFFPAEAAGGLKMIKAMAAPYVSMKFMPTGGVTPQNLKDYLSFPKILACGGTWMVKDEMVEAGDFAQITRLTRTAVNTMLGFELRHIGMNAGNTQEAQQLADQLTTLFGFEQTVKSASIFVSDAIEVMKQPYYGTKGHLAIQTHSIDRAVSYLKGKGIEFNHESAQFDPQGKLKALYFKNEIFGFALHLVRVEEMSD